MCCSLAKPGTSLGEAHTPRSSTAIAEASQGKVIGSLPVGSKPPRAASTIVSYRVSKPISRASAIGSMLSSSQGNIAFSPITRVSTLSRILRSLVMSMCERSEEQRLNSSHVAISYAVFCLKKKNTFIEGHEDLDE